MAPTLVLTHPARRTEGEPGELFRIAGEVTFRGAVVTLTARREDWAGCDPVADVSIEVPGDPGRELTYGFELPQLALPDGGGLLTVTAALGTYRVEESRQLVAGEVCPDCPRISLESPASGTLEPGLLFTRLDGIVVDASSGTSRWSVGTTSSVLLTAPLTLAEGRFVDVVVPLELGRNWIEVEADNSAGTTRCARYLDTIASTEERLAVSLGWSEIAADLDLFLVPPGGLYGPGACSAALPEANRFDGCEVSNDAASLGPETLTIPSSGPTGSFGVVVVGFSAPPDQRAPAYVRVLSYGRQIAAVGPREIVPALGELWVVGVATVSADRAASTFLVVDEVIDFAPRQPPERWPDY